MKKWKGLALATFVLSVLLTACSGGADKASTESGDSEKEKNIVIGVAAYSVDAAEALKESFEKKGYTLELKMFDDTITPNVALTEGTIDGTYHQHPAYLEAYNKDKGTDLAFVASLYFPRVGLYSEKYKSVAEFPEGAKIGIYSDASNQDRCLRILKDLGEIKVAEKDGLYSLLDITENPKNFNFVTMDVLNLASSVKDTDASFIGGYNYLLVGGDPSTSLAFDKYNSKYATGLTTRKEDKDAQWTKDFVDAALKDPKSRQNFDEIYKSSYELVKE